MTVTQVYKIATVRSKAGAVLRGPMEFAVSSDAQIESYCRSLVGAGADVVVTIEVVSA